MLGVVWGKNDDAHSFCGLSAIYENLVSKVQLWTVFIGNSYSIGLLITRITVSMRMSPLKFHECPGDSCQLKDTRQFLITD